jgi:hypothetical protein
LRFNNYTSYSKGINGIIMDISALGGPLAASDFIFKAGNDNNPASWSSIAAVPSINVRSGAGVDGSERVTVIWADNAIQKKWLQITVRATPNTGLAADDVFYFGNAIGETGDSLADAIVNATDVNATRINPHFSINPATITDAYDFDRDTMVNATDVNIARLNQTFSINALRLISLAGIAGSGLTANSVRGSAPEAAADSHNQAVPGLSTTRMAKDRIEIRAKGLPVANQLLETATDLVQGPWEPLPFTLGVDPGQGLWSLPVDPKCSAQFFRLRVEPNRPPGTQ